MKNLIIFLIYSIFSSLSYGQKIYRSNEEAYISNKFTYEFYLFNDSTCFLKGHYLNNSVYFIYKGTIKHTEDTLYEFKFQPLVSFACNERRHSYNDSVWFIINQVDTVLSSLTYDLKLDTGAKIKVNLKPGNSRLAVKNSDKRKFLIDTKFIDPLTHKKIVYTNDSRSYPDFTYYGTKTEFVSVKVSITNKKLIIFPDRKFIDDKGIFVLTN